MKTATKLLLVFTIAVILFQEGGLHAQEEHEDKTLSPYFFVNSDDPGTDRLPLKSTSADVRISGVIADVRVTQVYKNEGGRPIEAIYVFPASTRAAVYGMKMTIGERIINARVKKRDEARREYEQAVRQGRSASLLEQHRPNVFQMNVGNILPGDIVKVELSYTELLVPTDRIYEFVYPAVVGPRYSGQTGSEVPESETWIQNPYLHAGEAPDYTFNINVNISAGLPLQDVFCTSHKIRADFDGDADALIRLDRTEEYGGNRDFILKYRLAGKEVESGLLLYEGEKENFFLLMMQPPERIEATRVPLREYIFIVDVSGSMHGFPLEISKKLLKDLIGNLRPQEKFNVLLFAGGSSVMAESSVPATHANINRAINMIERQRGGGGTELLPALKRALALPRSDEYSRTIVIATDGYVSVEEQAFDLIRGNLGSANLFSFGIGSSVNRHIIEGMAHAGMGEPFIITKPGEAGAKAENFREMVQTPVLTHIEVDFGRFRAYDVEPVGIPDIMAERPVVVFGKWRGRPAGKIRLTGISGRGVWSDAVDVKRTVPSRDNAALRYLWARHRIRTLSDYNMLRPDDERTDEVVSLGLTYNLLTQYTSFVAVDNRVRNTEGGTAAIKQPLPLPQGVSDYAVGGVALKRAAAPLSFESASMDSVTAGTVKEEEVRESKRYRPVLKIGKIAVSGSYEEKDVKGAVEEHLDEIRRCYSQFTPGEKLTVEFIIEVNGGVRGIHTVADKSTDHSAWKCVVREMKGLRFPVMKEGGEVTVRVTFVVS